MAVLVTQPDLGRTGLDGGRAGASAVQLKNTSQGSLLSVWYSVVEVGSFPHCGGWQVHAIMLTEALAVSWG